MSHLCDSTVAGPTARRNNAQASKCEYPPFRYPLFKCAIWVGLELADNHPITCGGGPDRQLWTISRGTQRFELREARVAKGPHPGKSQRNLNGSFLEVFPGLKSRTLGLKWSN